MVRIITFSLLSLGVAYGFAKGTGGSNGFGDAYRVEAEVVKIERKCSFTVTTSETDAFGKSKKVIDVDHEENTCDTTDEFAKMRKNPEKRGKNIVGRATLKLSYTSPADSEKHYVSVKITGQDDAFYEVRKGDTVNIRASKSDPEKVELVS